MHFIVQGEQVSESGSDGVPEQRFSDRSGDDLTRKKTDKDRILSGEIPPPKRDSRKIWPVERPEDSEMRKVPLGINIDNLFAKLYTWTYAIYCGKFAIDNVIM